MEEKINTIIIDMYGVILKERKGNFIPYTFEHFDESQHERLDKQFNEERLFTKAGYGQLSSDEFLSLLGYEDTDYHMKNYIENYLTLDNGFIPFAEKYYRVFDFVLLSTDVSEWSAYITEYYNLDKYFKQKIVSGNVNCRKPDRKIYEITLEQIKKKASECIFIDDSVKNLLPAENMGIDSILFNRGNEEYHGKIVNSFEELDKLVDCYI